MTARLHQEIAREGGQHIEHIAQALGVSTRELVLPLKLLIVSGTIQTRGRKRATTYFATAQGAGR